MDVSVGGEYRFIMMDTRGYETVDELPLRNLTDGLGNHFLCYTPMIGKVSATPDPEACIALDGWLADQY
jgi:hypothetical protein